jgi:hypothetical protein
MEARHVYPGHGAPGGPELIHQTLEYLTFFLEAIKEKAKPGSPAKVTAGDLADIKKKLIARFPKHGAQQRIDASIEGEWATQIAALPPAPAAAPTEPGPAQAPAAPAGTAPAAAPAADGKAAPAKAEEKPAAKPDSKTEEKPKADEPKKKSSKKKSK